MQQDGRTMSEGAATEGQPGGRRIRRHRHERGQSLVEFALVLPLFLLLIIGIVDFGLALKSWITITNAAREGARYAAVTCVAAADDSLVITETEEASADLASDVVVTVTGCPGETADSVVVKVDYVYEWKTPLVGMVSLLGGALSEPDLNLSSSSDMRLE